MNCIMYGVRYVRYWYVAVTDRVQIKRQREREIKRIRGYHDAFKLLLLLPQLNNNQSHRLLEKQIPTLQRPLIFSSFASCSSRIGFHFSDSSSNNYLLEPRSTSFLRNYPLDLRHTTNGVALRAPAALQAALHRICINIAVASVSV